MTAIVNAAPMVVDLGINDLSRRVVVNQELMVPQHLPKFYIYAEKGPVGSFYVDNTSKPLVGIYGDATFNPNSKYYLHQHPYLERVFSEGNSCVVHRLIPEDANDVANIVFYLDVLPTKVVVYAKNTDGSIEYDSNGDPVPEVDSNGDPVTVDGYKVKWVAERISTPYGTFAHRSRTIRLGTQFDGSVQSKQYPIFEITAKHPGEYGNKLSIRMFPAYRSDIVEFPVSILEEAYNYPYYLQLLKYNEVDGQISSRPTLLSSLIGGGSSRTRFTLQEDALDPISSERLGVVNIFSTGKAEKADYDEERNFGTFYIYNDNLELLLDSFRTAELDAPNVGGFRDPVLSKPNTKFAFNILGFCNSNGSPYDSVRVVDDIDSIRFTSSSDHLLGGGFDGSPTIESLDRQAMDDMENYADPFHEYNDLVGHPESIMYDSGFGVKTKKSMIKFISRRKDTVVVLSTYVSGQGKMPLGNQLSIGMTLRAAVGLYPESTYFNTPVTRGVIVVGSGSLDRFINTSDKKSFLKRIPATYEIALKSARYMGAANGALRNGFMFDKQPLSIIEELKDLDATWLPASTRNNFWSYGLNFILKNSTRSYFLPAIKTVYNDDTSILNSYFTVMVLAYVNKIAHAAWRQFSGTVSLTNAQLEEKINEFVFNNTKDRFDNKYVIIPNATVTEMDAVRGYSWTLPIKVYGNNMKTVMTTYTESYRMEDLTTR